MIRRFGQLALAFSFLAAAAFGQGVRYDNVALTDTGRPANSATVRVCSAGSTGGAGCTPLATIYTNQALTVTKSNPFTTDNKGNYGFYAPPGQYDIVLSGSGITTATFKDQQLGPSGNFNVTAQSLTATRGGGGNVAGIQVVAPNPALAFDNSSMGTDSKWWDIAADGLGNLFFRVLDDSLTSPANYMTVNRTGTTVNSVTFGAPVNLTGGNTTTKNLIVNPSSTASGAALTVAGTSTTTGGISVFVGAIGSNQEALAVYPADLVGAAVRMNKLSIRASNAGFLSGAEVAGISNAGAITGTSATIGGAPVVTTTAAQNLTNKDLVVASGGNNVTLLDWVGSGAAVVGTGADANLFSFSVPANTMQAGKGIRVTVGFQHTTGTANVTYKLKFGATTVASNTENGTGSVVVRFGVMNNPGSQTAQTAWQETANDGTVIYSPQFATPAENTTGAVTLAFTFSVANTDQVTPKFFLVEVIQ